MEPGIDGRIILKEDLGKIACDNVDWFYLVQNRNQRRGLVNTVMNIRIQYKVRNFFNSWATISFSRRTLIIEVSLQLGN
jgi:hypothetical protein